MSTIITTTIKPKKKIEEISKNVFNQWWEVKDGDIVINTTQEPRQMTSEISFSEEAYSHMLITDFYLRERFIEEGAPEDATIQKDTLRPFGQVRFSVKWWVITT